jgi:transcriptional regulator GlxA family with amidase domain
MRTRRVAILIYDQVEVLDFAGPFEVFAVAGELHDERYFEVTLVAAEDRPYTAVNGLKVLPNRTFATLDDPDVLVVPGGNGSRNAMQDDALLAWVRQASESAEVVLSVCSGARILARLGLLDGLDVTTHHKVFAHLAELAPAARLCPGRRYVDTGKIVTTGGISAGIDGSFHLVSRLAGEDAALRAARYMEYDWHPDTAGEDAATSSAQVRAQGPWPHSHS